MQLILPSPTHKDAYLAFLRDAQAGGRHTGLDLAAIAADFDSFVQEYTDAADPTKQPPGEVPETMFWLIDGGQIVGQVSVRHGYNDEVRGWRGIAGGEIAPSQRGRGYGTALLRLAIEQTRCFGLTEVIITCDEDNEASRKIIERNGGMLLDEVARSSRRRLRYRIGLEEVMHLSQPSAEYEASFRAAIAEHQAAGESLDYTMRPIVGRFADDFPGYVAKLLEPTDEQNLPPGFVPDSVFWLIDDGEYIGRISIRHRLNDNLRRLGGHIGYVIRPSKRRQGYGTTMLRLVLPEARKLGLTQVLLTCNDDNTASWKIMEANGAAYEDTIEVDSQPIRRYWIAL